MIDPHDALLPDDLRAALHDEPPEKRRHLTRLWSLLEKAGDDQPVRPTVDEAWSGVRAATDTTSTFVSALAPDRSRLRRSRRTGVSRRPTIAVGMAAVMLVMGLAWIFRPISVATGPGEQRTVRLPDGSTVELNSATTVEYTAGFRSLPFSVADRRVELHGEAFFQVVEASSAFAVNTPDGRVEVLGTAFNVHSRPAERGTEVTVLEGRVQLQSREAASRPVILDGAGSSGRMNDVGRTEALPQDDVRLDHALAWRQRGFAVVDRPLDAVLNEIERRYAVAITPREGVDLSDPMNLFYLRGAAPDTILRDICLYLDCVYRETSRGFALAPRPLDSPDAHPPARN